MVLKTSFRPISVFADTAQYISSGLDLSCKNLHDNYTNYIYMLESKADISQTQT